MTVRSYVAIVVVIAICAPVCFAQSGRLAIWSFQPFSISVAQSVLLGSGSKGTGGGMGGPGIGMAGMGIGMARTGIAPLPTPPVPFSTIAATLGTSDLREMHFLFQPPSNGGTLETLAVQFLSGDQVVFETGANCDGCGKSYMGFPPSQEYVKGYEFALDEEALNAALPFANDNYSMRAVATVTASGDDLGAVFVVRASPPKK